MLTELKAPLLNTILGPAITDGTIVILLQLNDLNDEVGTVNVLGNSGVANDDETYSFEEGAEIASSVGTIDGDGNFSTTTPIAVLNFPVTVGDVTLNLPLRNVTLGGNWVGCSTTVTAGTMSGVILKEDADALEIEALGTNLGALFMNEPLNEAGDGWDLNADFTASQVEFKE